MGNELLDDLSGLGIKKEDLPLPVSIGGVFRLVALFFDFIAIIMLITILGTFMIILGFIIPESTVSVLNYVLFTSLFLLYYPVLESSQIQGSIGKFVVSIKVVDRKGKRLTFVRAMGRFLSTLLGCIPFFIGIIMIGLTDKRGMHDMMTDTYVVKNEKR